MAAPVARLGFFQRECPNTATLTLITSPSLICEHVPLAFDRLTIARASIVRNAVQAIYAIVQYRCLKSFEYMIKKFNFYKSCSTGRAVEYPDTQNITPRG